MLKSEPAPTSKHPRRMNTTVGLAFVFSHRRGRTTRIPGMPSRCTMRPMADIMWVRSGARSRTVAQRFRFVKSKRCNKQPAPPKHAPPSRRPAGCLGQPLVGSGFKTQRTNCDKEIQADSKTSRGENQLSSSSNENGCGVALSRFSRRSAEASCLLAAAEPVRLS